MRPTMPRMTKEEKKAADEAIRLRVLLERMGPGLYLVRDRKLFESRIAKYKSAMLAANWSDVKTELARVRRLVTGRSPKKKQKANLRSVSEAREDGEIFEAMRETSFGLKMPKGITAKEIRLSGAPNERVREYRKQLWEELVALGLWRSSPVPFFDSVFRSVARKAIAQKIADLLALLKAEPSPDEEKEEPEAKKSEPILVEDVNRIFPGSMCEIDGVIFERREESPADVLAKAMARPKRLN